MARVDYSNKSKERLYKLKGKNGTDSSADTEEDNTTSVQGTVKRAEASLPIEDKQLVSFRIPTENLELIKAACPEKYKNFSDYVNYLIDNDLEKNGDTYRKMRDTKNALRDI